MHAPSLFSVLGLVTGVAAKGVWTTPHDKYSSSVGVLGCKINTNRVAYWPGSVDCDNICVKLSYEGRSVHLLRIDQSGGAFDVSYDAWAYLQTGKSATAKPISGGSVAMEYEEVDASECADLIYTKGSKLPLSASNSINYLTSCLSQPNSWVAKNHVLYNICDAICTRGFDEECSLDLATSNQPSCPHTLGLTSELSSTPVYDIEYTSGKMLMAGTGDEAPADAQSKGISLEETPEKAITYGPPVEAPSAVEISSKTNEIPAIPSSTNAGVKPTNLKASASASGTADGGVFHELPSTAAPSMPTSSSISAPLSSAPESIIATSSQDIVSSAISKPVAIPTTLAVSSVESLHNSTTVLSTTSTLVAPSSIRTHTTLSVSAVSTSQSPSTTPSQQEPPQSAGHPAVSVSILGLALSIFACFVCGLF